MREIKAIVGFNDAGEEIHFESLYKAGLAGFDKKSIRRAISTSIKHKGWFWRWG